MILSTTKHLRHLIAAFCAFAAIGSANAFASPQDHFGKRISELTYEGVRTVDTSLIRRVSGIETGKVFNAGIPQEAIRQLFALSLFEDIAILADPIGDGGLRITIRVSEYPRLSQVLFEGNEKRNTDDLRDVLVLVPNQIISRDQIKNSQQAILNHYKEEGYFAATVDYRTESRPDSAIDLILMIDESEKIKIKKVTVLGVEQLEPGKVRGKMSNKADTWLRSGNYKPEEFPEDLKKIIAYYKKEGFLDAAILSDTVFHNDSIGGLEIQVKVHEGIKYYFGEVTLSGHTLFTDKEIQSGVAFIEGEVWSDDKFDKTMETFYAMLHEHGRLYSQVRDKQTPRDTVVDIHFEFIENEPAKIRFVDIIGNGKTKDKVIRRELSLFPGKTYRRSNLERSMRDLMVLNYFENLVPDIRSLPNGDVDIIIEVMEKSTGQISLGGGFSGQDGFVGTAGFTVPNFLGNGQNVSINLERGGRRSSFDISLTEPWFRDTRTSVGVDFFNLKRRSFDLNYDEDRSGLSLRVGRRLRWPDRYTSVFLSGRIQDLGYSDFDSTYAANWQDGNIAGPDPAGDWPQRLSSLSATIQRDSRDRAQFATRGSTISATFEYAGDAVGGFWHYHKQLFNIHKYFPLYKEVALIFKARWGFITPTVTSDLIPFLEKFQVGGTNGDGLVRGYDEGTVGTRLVTGQRTAITSSPDLPRGFDVGAGSSPGVVSYDRSESMTIYNLELQFPVAPPQIYGVLFMDAGRGFQGTKNWKFAKDLWRSAGIGGRMVVPGVGTIGFDMAYGFDGDTEGGWRPHFQIGRGF